MWEGCVWDASRYVWDVSRYVWVVVVVESDTPPAGPPRERPQAFLGGGPQGRICWNDPFLLASS